MVDSTFPSSEVRSDPHPSLRLVSQGLAVAAGRGAAARPLSRGERGKEIRKNDVRRENAIAHRFSGMADAVGILGR
jgi:hypothetical protein